MDRRLTNFRSIVNDGLEPLATRIEQDRVRIEIADHLPALRCDPIRCAQVVTNLVSNAIKYNQSDPKEVTIGFEVRGDRGVFSVRDNGIGIGYPDITFYLLEQREFLNYVEETVRSTFLTH